MSLNQWCDIVIPVWNHLEMTAACVRSIQKHTSYPYRLVIIDNASDKQTGDFLESLQRNDKERVAVIRNRNNLGFVRAVNQGMNFSKAPYVCIMNNDTITTSGWLGEMIDILSRHSDIGIINPSSNTSCQFPGELDIDSYADTLKAHRGAFQELYTGRAFAMVVKREVIERIGYLDEIYGMGYFDDTDYCKRAQALGYRAVRAKASYVYHKESQSFSKLKEKSAIFLENEKKFWEKWGRYLRVACVVPRVTDASQSRKLSDDISAIARMGHQAWVFTTRDVRKALDPIDHESIRYLCYPPVFFGAVVLYKIFKRKKKKKLDIVLTNDSGVCRAYGIWKKLIGADILFVQDFETVKKRLDEMSRYPNVR